MEIIGRQCVFETFKTFVKTTAVIDISDKADTGKMIAF